MNTISQDVSTVIEHSGWDGALHAFLAEKERRSRSRRTVENYSRMLIQFFGQAGKTPERVTSSEVVAFWRSRKTSAELVTNWCQDQA